MTNDSNRVDLEKLSNSLKVVENANNNLNNMSLSNLVSELDNDLNKVNFEHGHCLKGYKELLDSLIKEIESLKIEVNELDVGLNKSINSFKDIEYRKTDLLNNLDGEVTKIPEVNNQQEVETKEPINTVPIGLGIAAAGIAGSVGAVAVDSMMPIEKKEVIPEYEETVVEERQKPVEKEPEEEYLASETKFDDVTPYHASRNKEVLDKFYDEED